MSILTEPKKFDLHRGYPNGSALAEPFKIKEVAGVAVSLPGGSLVTQELQGTETVVDKATTPDLSAADPIQVWLVMEGNDDYSGEFTGMCMCTLLGSGIAWETGEYEAGAYPPGTAVSFTDGKIKVKAANEQIAGYVIFDKTATEGLLVIAS